MPKENNKVDINKHEIDIDTLFKQNVNDLSAIKELYRKLQEVNEKISQIKYIDSTLAYKLKKEYEKLKKIILDENIQVKLTNDIKTINSQLDTIVHRIKLSEIGMKTEDDGVNNFKILLDNIKKNTEFIVDGEYNIVPKKVNLNYDLILKGVNKNECGFNILDNGTDDIEIFEINENNLTIEFDNLKIKTSKYYRLINSWYGDKNLKFSKFDNCIFNGNMSVLRFKNANDIPISQLCGGTHYITNNTISNCNKQMFYLDNCPHELLEVKNNTISNNGSAFIIASGDPSSSYFEDVIKNKKLTLIENNIWINDENTFLDDEVTTYFALASIRANKGIYRNNHVEGLKTRLSKAIYDVYMSCGDVIYENNVYKNNLRLDENYDGSETYTLIKSKAKETLDIGERVYRNNKYIIEKDYLRKFTNDDYYVQLLDVYNECSFNIENNVIDVPFLRFQNGGKDYAKIKNLRFNNNKINVEKTKNYSMFEIGDISNDYEICNNEINILDNDNIFTLLANVATGKPPINKLVIDNNKINTNGTIKLLLEKVCSKSLFSFKDNFLNANSNLESRIFYDQQSEIIDINYLIKSKTICSGLCDVRLLDNFYLNCILSSNLCLPNSNTNRLMLPDDKLLNSKYIITLKFDNDGIEEKSVYIFKITNNELVNSITFTDNSDDTEKTINITKSGGTEYTLKPTVGENRYNVRFLDDAYAPRIRILRGSYADSVYTNKDLTITIKSYLL